MKKIRLFCFLIVFSNVCSAVNHKPGLIKCRSEFVEYEENWEKPLSFKEFLQILTELKIYSTSDFVKLKKEEGLPEGVPEKPLRAYPELKGQWSLLWSKIHDVRLSQGENVAKRRKLTNEEMRRFMAEISDKLEKEELDEVEDY